MAKVTGALAVQLIITRSHLANANLTAQGAVRVAMAEPDPIPAGQLANLDQCVSATQKALAEVSAVMDWAEVPY